MKITRLSGENSLALMIATKKYQLDKVLYVKENFKIS